MKNTRKLLALGGAMLILGLGTSRILAQDGGGGFGGGFGGGPGGGGPGGGGGDFDPAQMMQQMQQMMSDQQRQQLEITNDAEWLVIQAAIQKVTDARAQLNTGMDGGMFGMGGRRGGGGGFGGPGGRGQGGRMNIPGMPTIQPDPAAEALQKDIDANASSEELKAGIAKLLDSRKAKQAALEKAETDLRQLLSVRQEAVAYTMGLL